MFYVYNKTSNARFKKCKECYKSAVRKNRLDNVDYYRAYDKGRGCRVNPSYAEDYRERSPMKYKAHNKVNNALRDGRIKKPINCECCGEANRLVGHHQDYLQPLVVDWLCQPCHVAWHHKNGEGLNGGIGVLEKPF